MKPSITYREITVAIGILVAMVVAMTLWMGLPETEISRGSLHFGADRPSSARSFVINISTEFFPQMRL